MQIRQALWMAVLLNTPDLLLAVYGPSLHGLAAALAVLHALAALGAACFLLDFDSFADAAVVSSTEAAKALGFSLQSGGAAMVGLLLVAVAILGQCRAASRLDPSSPPP